MAVFAMLVLAGGATLLSGMKIFSPKPLLHVEGLVVLITAGILYRELAASWLQFAVLFLAPDLFMLGYCLGLKRGAAIYNAGHTYAAPFLLWLVVYFAHQPSLFPICVIWVAHIGFDRMLGYGLKYDTAFKDTHLVKV
ncbi:MAG TPA: DUF4260 domain-containing protein [Opitutaceae bacterium]|nr:DUF4260 domain-containing protein [Opitutaceae bacterium]